MKVHCALNILSSLSVQTQHSMDEAWLFLLQNQLLDLAERAQAAETTRQTRVQSSH